MYEYLNNLRIFFEEPGREVHIRGYAKILNKSPATSLKYLNDFAKKGLLIKRKERMHVLYKANFDNDDFIALKSHYSLNKIKKSGVIDFLVDSFNLPEAIFLFGSYADCTNDKHSDIDLCVITSVKKDVDLTIFEKKLKAKIQLFVFSKQELKKNKELTNNIINGKKLYGFLEVF